MKIYSKNRSFFFCKWVKELDPFFLVWMWLKEHFLSNMTRMELFSSKYDTELNFFEYDSKICFFFQNQKRLTETAQRIEHFFLNMTQRIVVFQKKKRLKEFFSKKKTTQRIKLFLENKTWLKELKFFWIWLRFFFFKIDSQNWIFFQMRLKKNELFFFCIWLKELNLFWMTQRIELFFD